MTEQPRLLARARITSRGFPALFGKDERDSGLEDSGFFSSDFLQECPRKFSWSKSMRVMMVTSGEKDVGGIEAAAETDFEDGELHSLAGKIFESHGGDAFEISGVCTEPAGGEELFDQDMDTRENFSKGLVADFRAIDADAFVDFFEMGGGIQSRSKAAWRRMDSRNAAVEPLPLVPAIWAVGVSAIGAAEALGEDGDVFEVELCRGGLRRRGQFAAEGEQVADCRVVVHFYSTRHPGRDKK